MVDVPAQPKRRLPFKPTALRQKSEPKPNTIDLESDSDSDLDLFKRSKTFFPKTLAQKEALRKRKTSVDDVKPPVTPKNKGKQKEVWPPSRESTVTTNRSQSAQIERSDDSNAEDLVKTPPSKRSRHSLSSNASHSGSRRNVDQSRDNASPSKRAPSTTTAHHSPIKVKHELFRGNPVISLDDSDDEKLPVAADDDDIYGATPIRKLSDSPLPNAVAAAPAAPSSPDPFASDNDDTDEFAEYVRAARERQEKAKEAISASESSKPPTLMVFVTSEIPGAQEKRFHFLLDKRLRVVRDAWCDAQHEREFTPEERDEIFLTWRGRRLYDSTTVASLNVRVIPTGELSFAASQSWSDREGIIDGTILHIEAWTDEIWDLAQKRKERARLRDLGELEDDSQDEDSADNESVPELEEEQIKVILKTRDNDKDAVKTRARPLTTINELISYFRSARSLPNSTQIALHFDGEQLDRAMTLQDAEIEDMDTIEVHMKG